MSVTEQQFNDHADLNNAEFANRQILLRGVGVPNQPATLGSYYHDESNAPNIGDRYEKTGPLDTDWTLVSSGSVGADATALCQIRNCAATLAVGDLVWESTTIGDGVDKVTNNTDIRPVVGFCVVKPTTTTARVCFHGRRTSSISGLTKAGRIWVSSAGTLTSSPSGPGSGWYLQALGSINDPDKIDFSPSETRVLRRV